MRDESPPLPVRPAPARRLAGVLLLALAGGLFGLDAAAAPAITSIDPESGGNFNRVTITGTGFGSSRGSSTVTFGGTEARRYYEWSDTEIAVQPPSILPFGANAVVVTVGGQASGGVDYTRLPALTALCSGLRMAEPSGSAEVGVLRSGPTTDALTVSVAYTGAATPGPDYTGPSTVTIDADETEAYWTLRVVDDAGKEGDERILITVEAEGYLSAGCQMTLVDDDPDGTPAPAISRLSRTTGGAGAGVVITGRNFGTSGSVGFNGTQADTTRWSATSIRATVPAGATTGNVVVTVGGQASNGIAFTVTPTPEITGLDPSSGGERAGVVITGRNFGEFRGSSQVTFNGRGAATPSWSETSIRATVPEGVTTGPVVVTVGGLASNGVTFTVVESDKPVRLSCGSSVSEPSGRARVEVTLNPGDEPDEDATFTITYAGTADKGVDYSVGTLTIEAGERSAQMDPRLTVIDDTSAEGEETIELTVTAAGYKEASCTIRLKDDEAAISSLKPAAGPVGTSVVITGTNFGTAKGTSTVTFNGTAAATTAWSATSITATVPAGAGTGNVVVRVGEAATNGVPFTVTGVTVAPTALTIDEGGTGTYTVVLDSQPTAAVTVSMFAPEGTDLSVDLLPVFTASNWDEAQTVTVTAGEDADQEDDTVTLAHRTASADAGYHDLAVDSVEVTVTDNDVGAGVRVAPTGLTLEEGEEGSYTLVLRTEPTADVTVTVEAGGDLAADPSSLTFTASNWNTARTVTVTAGEDEDAADETETVSHTVTSTDTAYSGLAVDSVKVTVADDEGTGGPGGTEELTVSTTRLRITEGNMGKYTVVLNRAPAAGVTVAVSAPAGGDLTVSPASLSFTPSNWDTPQEVMVEAGHDADLADEVESITHTITRGTTGSSSSLRGGLWRDASFATAMGSPAPTREYVYLGERLVAIAGGGTVGEASVVVTIDDDDDPETPGVPALTDSLRLTEGHTGAYTLELGAAPTADVAIALSVSPGSDAVADVSVSPASVTFGSSNWDSPQWITVSVGRDSDTVGETETITHTATSTDSRYEGITIAPVRVVIRDRNPTADPPEGTLTASPSPCTIAASATVCSTTLTWTSTNTAAVQVRRIKPGTETTLSVNEIVLRSGNSNGSVVFERIDLTESPFYLYEYITATGRRGRQLATVTVHGVKQLTLSPSSGPVGTEVTIMGSHFGTTQGTVSFGGTTGEIESWSDTRIVVEVPEGLTAGAKTVAVTVNGTARTVGTFTVTDDETLDLEPKGTLTARSSSCTIADDEETCQITLDWTRMHTTRIQVRKSGSTTALANSDTASGNLTVEVSEGSNTYRLYDYSGGTLGNELDSVTVTGRSDTSPMDRPTIGSCSASPVHVKTGGASTLSWSAANATSVVLNPGNIDLTNDADSRYAVTLSEAGPKTYTLTASNPDWTGPDAASCTIGVTAWGEPTASISANRTGINQGQPVTLTWSSTNVSSTVISGLGSVTANGSRELTPAQGTREYEISAANWAWTGTDAATDSVTVTVDAKPTGTISASPNPCHIAATATTCTTTLRWSGSGTTGLLVRVSHNNAASTVVSSSGRTGTSSPSWIQRSPTNRYLFYLYDYENRVQGARLASLNVRGVKTPVISSLSRTQGNADSEVWIYGLYFDSAEGTVTFGGVTAEINSWSDTRISVQVPGELGEATVQVKVTANDLESNELDFRVLGRPVRGECDEDDEDDEEEECEEDDEEKEKE